MSGRWRTQPSAALIKEARRHFSRFGLVSAVAAGKDKDGFYLRVWFDPEVEVLRKDIEGDSFREYRVKVEHGRFFAHA